MGALGAGTEAGIGAAVMEYSAVRGILLAPPPGSLPGRFTAARASAATDAGSMYR